MSLGSFLKKIFLLIIFSKLNNEFQRFFIYLNEIVLKKSVDFSGWNIYFYFKWTLVVLQTELGHKVKIRPKFYINNFLQNAFIIDSNSIVIWPQFNNKFENERRDFLKLVNQKLLESDSTNWHFIEKQFRRLWNQVKKIDIS